MNDETRAAQRAFVSWFIKRPEYLQSPGLSRINLDKEGEYVPEDPMITRLYNTFWAGFLAAQEYHVLLKPTIKEKRNEQE